MKAEFESLDMIEQRASLCIVVKANMIVVCYVIDLLIFAKMQHQIDQSIGVLEKKVVSKDLGVPRQFLEITIEWTAKKDGVALDQESLINRFLKSTRMNNAKGMKTTIGQENQAKDRVKL